MPVDETLPEVMTRDHEVRDLVLRSHLTADEVSGELALKGYDISRFAILRSRKSQRKTALILSDWQVDLHDESFLWRVFELAKAVQPDMIVHVGDESDNTSIGRWVKGLPEEVEGNLQRQIDLTHDWLKRFREIDSVKEMGIVSSNHGLRFENSVNSRIPAFRHLRALRYESLFGLDELRIDYRPKIWEFLPGVLAGHGDQWYLTSKSQYSKLTEVASHKDKCIVAGHTHRPMVTTVAGDRRSLWVMNVGHSMDLSKADYMDVDRGGIDQWGQAVGLVHFNGTTTHPELIMDVAGRMHWNGRYF